MTDVTNRPTARERQAAEVAELKRHLARWKKAIEGLTPSGSEFVDDPERCAVHILARTIGPRKYVEMGQRVEQLEALFAHVHVRIQDSDDADTCAQCGLDLRDRIHLRVDDPRRKGVNRG